MLDNAFRIHHRMQVVYKEIACDEGKSIKAKWNLIGIVQFKHMKNCLKLTCSAMIGYVLIRLWMFFFIVCNHMQVFWCVHCEKRSGKTHFNLKMIQK